jgi:hypothetical protein
MHDLAPHSHSSLACSVEHGLLSKGLRSLLKQKITLLSINVNAFKGGGSILARIRRIIKLLWIAGAIRPEEFSLVSWVGRY